MSSEEKIKLVGNEIIDMLIAKNKAYGDSALNPLNIFSKGTAEDALRARMDDKLARIKNKGISSTTEDTLMDLGGYIILLMIARRDRNDTFSKEELWNDNRMGRSHIAE